MCHDGCGIGRRHVYRQFDGAMYDLVNFLAYTAEPFKADRQRIGTYVLLFLVVFFIFAWLLNREYWKDVH